MLQRLALSAAPHQLAQRHEFGFGKISLEIEIKLESLSPKNMGKQMLSI